MRIAAVQLLLVQLRRRWWQRSNLPRVRMRHPRQHRITSEALADHGLSGMTIGRCYREILYTSRKDRMILTIQDPGSYFQELPPGYATVFLLSKQLIIHFANSIWLGGEEPHPKV